MSATEDPARLALLAVVGPEDGERANGLLATLARFNRDCLPVFAVGAPLRGAEHVSWSDLGLTAPSGHDESFALGLAALSFAGLGRVGAYVTVPLATTFVRPFGAADFLADDGSPRAFLTEDAEGRAAGVPTGRSLDRIRTRLGMEDHRCLNACDPVVYGADQVNAMIAAASPDGTAASLMQIAPDAAGWYASWLQLTNGSGLDWQEPVFLQVGSQGGAVEYSLRQASEADIARGYVGYVGTLPHRASASPLSDVSAKDLAQAAGLRSLRKAPRLQRLLERVLGQSPEPGS